jgi:rsbT antagonist protein RsbS
VGLAIDLSAVRELDSYLTRAIRDVAMLARLMGVATVVCGIRPAVAITLVDMGLELPGVQTAMNLERAVELLDELVAESERAEAEDDDDAADGDDLESGDEVDAG